MSELKEQALRELAPSDGACIGCEPRPNTIREKVTQDYPHFVFHKSKRQFREGALRSAQYYPEGWTITLACSEYIADACEAIQSTDRGRRQRQRSTANCLLNGGNVQRKLSKIACVVCCERFHAECVGEVAR